MKQLYIGRIKLSKQDSEEWYKKPPFMYVVKNGCPDRSNINCAIMFDDKDECKKALIDSFKEHEHLPDSKMEILTLNVVVTDITHI